MRVQDSDRASDNSDFQDDSINGSTVLINPTSMQRQTSIESENSLSTLDENEIESSPLPPFVNDFDVNQVELLEQNLSQIFPPPYNIFSSNEFQEDQQSYDENASMSRYSESLTEESQISHQFESPIQISYDEIMNKTAQNLDNNDTNIRKAFGNDIKNKPDIKNKSDYKNKPDSKKSIRNVLKNQKFYMNTQTEYDKDLVEYIPGLYRLLSKADDSSSSADHIILSKDSLKKLCNDWSPLSFKSISEINYTKLNSISFRLIGCYGNHALIAKFLLNNKIINQKIHNLLTDSQSSMEDVNKPSLRPGIYLLVVNPDLGLVIHWPENGCYEENASPQKKQNMINFHKYLTKLTDHQLCFMIDNDLESFDWNLNNPDLNTSDENESCYEFEVKKSQEEQDDFEVHDGFKVNLSLKIKTDMNVNHQYDVPLYPIVVESTTNQSFITRKMVKKLSKNDLTFSAASFSTELCKILQERSLYIDRKSMDMKQLEFLIKNGFKAETKLLKPFDDAIDAAKSRMKKKIDQAKRTMEEDAEIITRMGWKKSYSIFETFVDKDLFDNSENDDKVIEEEEINRIQSKYPEVKDMIKKIKINSPDWIRLKKRYAMAYLVINNVYRLLNNNIKRSEEIIERAIQEFYSMFIDVETDTHKLVEKYELRSRDFFSSLSTSSSVPQSKSQEKLTFDKLRINQTDEQSKRFILTKSDSEFVQDIINSQFFAKLNHIRQDVLVVFSNEYQNWRKDNFPNSVKEMVPTFSFNKQLMDKINDDFSREKEEIENHELERICYELEKGHRNGLLRLNLSNISNVTDITDKERQFCLNYELETNRLQITIYETLLDKSDDSHVQDDESYVPNLILSSDFSTGQYGVDFMIDPTIYDFRKISQFENCKFLLVLYNKNKKRVEIFFDTAQQLARRFKKSDSIKPIKILNINENFLVAVNEPKELIAIFDTNRTMLNVYSFSDDQTNLYARNPDIELLRCYNDMVPDIQYFLFIKDTEELCFVEKGGQALIFNLINQRFRPAVSKFPSNTANVLSTPDGSCIVAFVKEKVYDDEIADSRGKDICRAYVYFCANFGGSVSKVVNLPQNLESLVFLQFTRVNKLQTHLLSFDLPDGYLTSAIVKVTMEKTHYHIQERTQKQSIGRVKLVDSSHKNVDCTIVKGKGTHFEKTIQKGQNIVIMGERYNVVKVLSDTKLRVSGKFKSTNVTDKWAEFYVEPIESKTKSNYLIDVYKLMVEKYPIENCIDPQQNHPFNLKIVLDIDETNDIEEYTERFENYVIESLRHSVKKFAAILKKFSVPVITFQELDIDDVRFLSKYSSYYDLGEWMIKLCCIIPIQIAVTKNNSFQPLKDGLSWDEGRVEFDNGYGHYIDSIAKSISFGWYEGIFKYFGNKKIKVVSTMGEQSCEKSLMLNHLIGTSFDESAMGCTEGIWMSLVYTKKYLYVALNFEGQKRTPQEDLFLMLFNTIVSNLILFKVDSILKVIMLTMFQKFQDGALFFESGSKIPQAKLSIVLDDAPNASKEDIVKEFKSNLSQFVLEEGEGNFMTKMYKGKMDIISWPAFNDAAWFKNLENVSKKLAKQEEKHENARTFLQNTKVIMAKLKICDWSSLEETLMQIRIATLKRLLPTVISCGLEQKDYVTRELMNYDTEKPIDDPIVSLSDILNDFKESTKISPDSDIQLLDENGAFEEFFDNLRNYFEDVVQSRKESSDDSKWFANFDKFIKYIIERRVSRVKEWYLQNTSKFPQDNNDIVHEKYAMEQETDRLTLLWTLCGSTCHRCSLKCVKNRDHENNHDCLTDDHKCHFICNFDETHNRKLVPNCIYIAGHEGKHVCDQNHLCGEPCNLIDKLNCQRICSKEIGHDGEHLCESTLHYCGEDCSLSTYTQKGDYRCPNKCVMPYNEEHDSHRCENETCPIQCPIPSCQKRCQSNDHFHSYSDLMVDHFCGNEHLCQEFCEDDGVCKVVIEPKQQITRTKYIQSNEKLKCSKKIPPNEFEHIGKHTHKEDGFHYCNVKCKYCEYYCTLPYGHTQIHETRHGNMKPNEFTSDDNFEFTGQEVLCNLKCKGLGRHPHVDYCQNEENCRLGNQRIDIQHIDERAHPHPDRPKDLISHKLYWERTGFKDPYSVQEQKEFAKWNHERMD
ncbi:hypothetical protein RhiirA4_469932 [Rhizophagus irregularis]|uniref:VWFA domain-containing protein n=1 Tax=Rhizophagus irregularis TaxID=588596 RepID=A0A2I1H0E8_9GLOM|nr:hypothetical protein RhiirA4_469932 [Rhizophagus irregularis]